MMHMFDTEIATKYGVNAAVIFQNIAYWCEHERANFTNYHDGLYWTYNSVKAFQEQFPYLGKSQISSALQKLVDEGLIVKGNYNKLAYDRTGWYAVTALGETMFRKYDIACSENQTMEISKIGNGDTENRKPIPDINSDIRNTPYKNTSYSHTPYSSCTESPTVYQLPLNDGTMYAITQEDFGKYERLYPVVDVMEQLRKMDGWLDGNPQKRKTRNGIRKFINNWLSKAQDSGVSRRESVAEKPAPHPQKKAPPAVPYVDPNNWWNGMTRDEFIDATVAERDENGNVIGKRMPDGRFVPSPK